MKQFIFRYSPQESLEKLKRDVKHTINTKQRQVEPKNLIVTDNIKALYQIVNENRLELFACLKEKQPANLQELSQLLHRKQSAVKKDVQSLADLGIIKLQKKGLEIKPVALYEKIVFDFGASKAKEQTRTTASFL
jgi:predicted transcriptional regulator